MSNGWKMKEKKFTVSHLAILVEETMCGIFTGKEMCILERMRGLSFFAKYSLRSHGYVKPGGLGARYLINLPFKSPSPPPNSPAPSVSEPNTSSENNSEEKPPTVDYFEDYLVFSVRVIVLLGVISGFYQNSKLLKQCGDDGNEIQRLESSMEQITAEICHENFRKDILRSYEEEAVKGKQGGDVLGNALKELVKRYPQIQEEQEQEQLVAIEKENK
jgi:hypothetical protein